MIELALLGLLSEQNLHGYELKKQLGELLGPWSAVSFGSLYPALGRLEKAGAVRVLAAEDDADRGTDEPAAPMTGALSGELAAFRRLGPRTPRPATGEHGARPRGRRGKKVYVITEAGRSRFAELLAQPSADDDRSFALKVAFCRHLPADERLTLFERRKADLATQLTTRRRASPRRADPYRRLLGERDTRALAHDIAWIDELIDATRSDTDGAVAAAPAGTGVTGPDDAADPTPDPSPDATTTSELPPPMRPRVTPSPSLSDLGAHARRARSVKAGSDS